MLGKNFPCLPWKYCPLRPGPMESRMDNYGGALMRRRGAARSGGCALRFSASRRRSRTSCGAWPSSSASWRRRGPRSLPVSRRRRMTEIEPAMPSPEEVHEFFAGLGIKHIPNLDKAIHRLADRTLRKAWCQGRGVRTPARARRRAGRFSAALWRVHRRLSSSDERVAGGGVEDQLHDHVGKYFPTQPLGMLPIVRLLNKKRADTDNLYKRHKTYY